MEIFYWNEFQYFYWEKDNRKKTLVKNFLSEFFSLLNNFFPLSHFSYISNFKNIQTKNRIFKNLFAHQNYKNQSKKIRREKIRLEMKISNKFKPINLNKIKKVKVDINFNYIPPFLNLNFFELIEPLFSLKKNDIFIQKAVSKKKKFLTILVETFFFLKKLRKVEQKNKKLPGYSEVSEKINFEEESERKIGNVIRKCIHLYGSKNGGNLMFLKIEKLKKTLNENFFFYISSKVKKVLDLGNFSTTSLIKINRLALSQINLGKGRGKKLHSRGFFFEDLKKSLLNEYGKKI
jgi:hypothetical protein